MTQAGCSSCHSLEAGPDGYPLFTDFGYDNLGVPKNPDNPFYDMPTAWNPDGENWVDYGLGGYLKSAGYDPEVYEPELGKQKVPTLRNVDLRPSEDFVKAYGHNGYFKSLEDIVFFYHWRAMMDSGMCGGMGGGGMGGGMGGGCENANHVPASRSGPEPSHVDHVPHDADRQHRHLPEDTFGWLPAINSYKVNAGEALEPPLNLSISSLLATRALIASIPIVG